jgi:hypothetical protein
VTAGPTAPSANSGRWGELRSLRDGLDHSHHHIIDLGWRRGRERPLRSTSRHAGTFERGRSDREPLLNAIFNLETRIYNVIELDFFGRFLGDTAEPSDREYAVLNTLYVFAQYFCWVEILRRESQFIDPRNDQRTADVVHGIEAVRDTFTDSQTITRRHFRLFRGEQRALGEVMLVAVPNPPPGAPRWECMGYASFVQELETPGLERWFCRLRADITTLTADVRGHDARLRLVQRRLIELIDIIDPDARRVPIDLRKLVDVPDPRRSTA